MLAIIINQLAPRALVAHLRKQCQASLWAIGSSYSAASPSDIVHPKSTIHFPAGRLVRSMPFTHGFRTSALVRPFGFAGKRSHARA